MTSWQSANAAMHGGHAKYPHWDADFLMHNASRVKSKRKKLLCASRFVSDDVWVKMAPVILGTMEGFGENKWRIKEEVVLSFFGILFDRL